MPARLYHDTLSPIMKYASSGENSGIVLSITLATAAFIIDSPYASHTK